MNRRPVVILNSARRYDGFYQRRIDMAPHVSFSLSFSKARFNINIPTYDMNEGGRLLGAAVAIRYDELKRGSCKVSCRNFALAGVVLGASLTFKVSVIAWNLLIPISNVFLGSVVE